jgi:hypothetical protein
LCWLNRWFRIFQVLDHSLFCFVTEWHKGIS